MGVKHSMVSDNNAQFWYTSSSIKGGDGYRDERTNKCPNLLSSLDSKRRGEDCTREIQYCLALLMRNNFQRAVIWLNGHANAFDWPDRRLTMTLSEAYHQEEEEEADDCDMTKPWKLNMQTFSIENKGAIAWKLDMQTFSIKRTRALLQSITENASFKGSEIALL